MSENLQKYVVKSTFLIHECVAVIQRNKSRCVVVIDNQEKVIGVLSEGDVLRALIRGVDLHASISGLYVSSFQYLFTKDIKQATVLVKKYGITLVPIVNQDYLLQDIVTIFDVLEVL